MSKTPSEPSKFRVLLLDDEPSYSDQLLHSLRNKMNFEVATNVDDARRMFQMGDDFDVVVLDIALGKEGTGKHGAGAGLEFLEQARATGKTSVVVLSALPPHIASNIRKLGADEFISKLEDPSSIPFVLERAIRSTKKKARSQRASGVNEGDVRRIVEKEVRRFLPEKERVLDLAAHGRFDLLKPLVGYKNDIQRQLTRFPYERNVFLMMKYRDSNAELGKFIAEIVAANGLNVVRADDTDWNITHNVYNPVAVLYCCKYGIALFDEGEQGQAFSPNVAYELAMMHYQGKDCLILRHASLPAMPFDLLKDLYREYSKDLQVRAHIQRWIQQVVR